jgi:hypothetical protein
MASRKQNTAMYKKLDHLLSTNHILVESENIPTYCLYFIEVLADSLEVGPIWTTSVANFARDFLQKSLLDPQYILSLEIFQKIIHKTFFSALCVLLGFAVECCALIGPELCHTDRGHPPLDPLWTNGQDVPSLYPLSFWESFLPLSLSLSWRDCWGRGSAR